MYQEEDFLLLSGIQHFAFCTRQWALIYIEQQWAENIYTAEGKLMHKRAHDASQRERRGDVLILRELRVFSRTLGIVGHCDVVEFHQREDGVSLYGQEGLWTPFPVEYKRGRPKSHRADELQLCAQACCLEEMLCCEIAKGALFYGETKRRQEVLLDGELRAMLRDMVEEMHRYMRRGHTPRVKPNKGCMPVPLRTYAFPHCIPPLRPTNGPRS